MTTTAPVELTARRPLRRRLRCRLFLRRRRRHRFAIFSGILRSPPSLFSSLFLFPLSFHLAAAVATDAANGDAGICQRQKKTEIGRKDEKKEAKEGSSEREDGMGGERR